MSDQPTRTEAKTCNSVLHRRSFWLYTGVVAAVFAAVGGVAYLATAAAPKIGPAVGDEAKDFELPALDGTKVKLSALTEKGPVVLLVLRGYPGYQCPLCTRQVGDYLGKADAFKKAGATVVMVYPGPAADLDKYAKEFTAKTKLAEPVVFVTDPGYEFTTAYGLRWEAKNETAYPSTFVIDKGRKVTFAKVSTTHGDRTKADDALKALAAK